MEVSDHVESQVGKWCLACQEVWPCSVARLRTQLAEARRTAIERNDAYEKAISSLADLQREVERLKADNKRQAEAHQRIIEWADAYPLSVFSEPDFKQAATVLKAAGMALDAISASNFRHCLKGVKEIARAALEQPEEGGKDGRIS